MSPTPASTLVNLQQTIDDLQRQLAEAKAERDEFKAERDEALEQQTATAEVLGVINSSPGDLAPVFDAMLERALRLCDASFGTLFIRDGDVGRLVAWRNVPEAFADYLTRDPMKLRTILGPNFRDGPLVHIEDLAVGAPYRNGIPLAVAAVDLGGIRGLLAAPLMKDDTLIGLFAIYRPDVRPFSDKQIALLQNFAAQAVIAMENARLITETREALEQQTATAEVLGVINSSPGDLAPVFDAMLEKATLLAAAAFGHMFTYDGESFRTVAAHRLPAQLAALLTGDLSRPTPNSPPKRIIDGEDVVSVNDLRSFPSYRLEESRAVALVELGGVRSYVIVALRKDRQLLGMIAVYRQEVRPFSDKQIALLQNFAAQAVIAMENARLITETREALEQQTATAEVLGVINSSPGDLAPVFDAVLEKAVNLCGAAFGVLQTNDGDRFRTAATHGVPPAYADYRRHHAFVEGPGSLGARIRAGEGIVHVLDLKDDEPYRAGDANRVPMVDLGGARTGLAVALTAERGLLGFIIIYRQEIRLFSDRQIALLQNFAAQAVIAIENARLITQTREALEQQTATAEVLGVINSSPGDLAPVFEAILEKAHSLCGADFGGLLTYDGAKLRPAAQHNMPSGFTEKISDGFRPHTEFARLLRGERFVHTHDLAEIVAQSPDEPLPRAAVEVGGIRTQLLVPLRKDDKLLGIITANRNEIRPFSDRQIALLQNFAAQAVIAMENARLLGELRQRTDEVAELNRGLEARVAEQVEELGRVGRLKRFLAPQLAELIVSQGDEKILESHRREIVVVFCDLRGYTAFTETAEPEEVLDFLREYHGALGPLVAQFEGTLDQFSGDGIMVFFNDPVPIPDAAERAVKMAVAMRDAAGTLIADWRERGRELGFGAGIAQGYATLGQIGFSERSGYTAIGTVCNVAARLCDDAKDGQILLSQRVNVALKGSVATEQVGALALKGLTQPVVAYNVPLAASQPALRVIEGGPPSI